MAISSDSIPEGESIVSARVNMSKACRYIMHDPLPCQKLAPVMKARGCKLWKNKDHSSGHLAFVHVVRGFGFWSFLKKKNNCISCFLPSGRLLSLIRFWILAHLVLSG
ncbi:hypothetical protein Peur_024188 [Populus x canadensis]